MFFFKKIKQLIKHKTNTAPNPQTIDNDGTNHLSPISNQITTWLNENNWKFQHVPPDDDDAQRIHLFFLGFANETLDWQLVIRVQEKLQLVTFFGTLETPIAPEHRLSALALLAERSLNLYFGDLDLDLSTGMMRAKLYFDAEFSRLTNRMLDNQIHLLYQLVELNQGIADQLPNMPTIADLSELLTLANQQRAADEFSDDIKNGDGQSFFAPSGKRQ